MFSNRILNSTAASPYYIYLAADKEQQTYSGLAIIEALLGIIRGRYVLRKMSTCVAIQQRRMSL